MTDEEKASAQTAGGYAREMSEDYQRRQRSSSPSGSRPPTS